MVSRIVDLFMQEGRSTDQARGGLGSEFLIGLPALATGAAPTSKGVRKAAGAKWPRRRLLVVDDSEGPAIALKRMLARLYGQDVEVAHDGPSAPALALTCRPEVVLLDIAPPGMDGFEVARRLRAIPGFETVIQLTLTDRGQEEGRPRPREAGFDHHLAKPVDPEAILEVLTKMAKGSK